MVIDGLVRHFTRGRRSYDRDAQMAARGRLLPALLDELLAEPYFRRPPPKTAGREQYGKAYRPQDSGLGPPPSRTARRLGAHRHHAHRALDRRRLPPLGVAAKPRVAQLIVSGGGARNPLIMRATRRRAAATSKSSPSDALGVPGDAKEAFAFALLADETMHGRPANLPSATGATRPAILGKICYPPPR